MGGNVEIPNWLKGLPMAPVFRPTDTEFTDPIAYISKIEKEASAFGICKIIPPVPRPSKKYVFNNLNKSLVKSPELGDALKTTNHSENKIGEEVRRAVFTTRQQELGTSVKKVKATVSTSGSSNQQVGINKQVWQSGKVYTLEQFEAKSKAFARNLLGAAVKDASPLVIEAMFWKATSEKPIYVEYANDVPGSGFGEPEGHICKRRRRTRTRTYYRRQGDKDDEVDDKQATYAHETKDVSPKKDIGASLATTHSPCSSSSVLLDETPHDYRKSGSSGSNESEGTAGWKLSNSPWNLQVIARSAGSLTRFMPDDIPGVTSPMVYIGMLFSWFAWHVEDHELHSMNFLHVGAPKTWYAVPGDYAFDFEEVIHTDAYGGNIDRLAGLSRLGEKTTVLSPEVMVTSGIPCCRLVQNPGEFVVTFPRAYHIGFSHGFNCGEAANFATPQWLRYAREAAVRRAAMSYLPMLSHQQLLYLLTMSFMSRIPRSLIPGARSSRLRDRQREEKELLVKKAFLDDMLNENHLLYSLLGKDLGYRAIVWNPSLLTSVISKESGPGLVSTSANETVAVNDCPKSPDNLLGGSYMEAQADLDIEDDLFFDFQVDSGTLACVACGVLGFPFMCVMQPSSASAQLLQVDCSPLQKKHEDLVDGTPKDLLQLAPGTSDRFLRPRVFCLEHGIQVQELLQNKGGGAKLLVICHSDYQKIKAYAATIAEETRTSFDYKEIPLEGACQEDLNLIEVAIVDDGHSEDWTSRLGINLQHSVKVRKNFPAKHQFQHALTLGGLFSGHSGSSTVLKANWKARKSRSKTNRLDHPRSHEEPCKKKRLEAAEMLLQKKRVQNKIIQYTRRIKKLKSGAANDKQHEVQVVQVLGDVASGFVPAQAAAAILPDLTSLFVGAVEVQIINQTSLCGKNMEVVDGESSSFARSSSSSVILHNEDGISRRTKENTEHIKDSCVTEEVLNDEYTTTTTPQVSSEATEIPAAEDVTALLLAGREGAEAAISKVIVEEKVYCRSIDSQMQQPEIGEVSRKESSEGMHDAGDDNKLSKEEALFPAQVEGEEAVIPALIEEENWHGVKESPISDSAEEEDNCTSKVPDGRECSSSFDEEFHPTTSSSSSVSKSDQKAPPLLDSSSVTVVTSTSDRLLGEEVKVGKRKRRKSELELIAEEGMLLSGSSNFVKSPCEGLRPRSSKVVILMNSAEEEGEKEEGTMRVAAKKKSKQTWDDDHRCNLEGCKMKFKTKQQVLLHKRNRCHIEGCGKKFSSHKYAVLHQRVHDDDRPFKCPWKGCPMSFKWLWARTEHIRVHSGERPYKCKVDGCDLSFRFISDYSRHRRKTGHYVS